MYCILQGKGATFSKCFHSNPSIKRSIKAQMARGRRGQMVIASAYGTGGPRFESRSGEKILWKSITHSQNGWMDVRARERPAQARAQSHVASKTARELLQGDTTLLFRREGESSVRVDLKGEVKDIGRDGLFSI